MKYLSDFLSSYSEDPAKPAKPLDGIREKRESSRDTPGKTGETQPIGALDKNPPLGRHHPDPPDRGYLTAIAFWPESYQRRWRERATENQWRGMTRPQAEWNAFLKAVDAINEAEAEGKAIEFRHPDDRGDGPPPEGPPWS